MRRASDAGPGAGPRAGRRPSTASLALALFALLVSGGCDERSAAGAIDRDDDPRLSSATGDRSATATAQARTTTRLGGSTMGTSWTALVPDALDDSRRAALSAALESELARIDGLMSTWNPDSELSRFNRRDDTLPIRLHADTLALVDTARSIARDTGGAYDVTLGPLIDLWGFGGGAAGDGAPDEATIARALAAGGDGALVRGDGTLAKARAEVALDLSSLAKGFAVDRLGETLEALGHAAHLVEIGGEVRTRGRRADGTPWRVGIERPDGPPDEGLALGDAHVASSGSYRNVRRVNGRVVSHILDGRTGRPVAHALVAVTVLHPRSTTLADAWATALLVLGPDAARDRTGELGLAVQLITATADGGFETWRSDGFVERLADGD